MTDEQKLLKIISQEKRIQEMARELRNERVTLVRSLNNNGLSLRKIAKLTGVSHNRVSQWIGSADVYQPE